MRTLKDIVARLEESPVTFGQWLATALSIIVVRDSLETVLADRAFPFVHPFHVLHFPIFFLSMLLFVIVILHFFTKEDILKVSRICLFGSLLILVPVVMDFFTALSTGRALSYGYIEENIAGNYFGFFNPFFVMPTVPYSIRIEMALMMLLSYGYIHLKRKNEFLSLCGALSVYTAAFFYGAMPAFFVKFYMMLAPVLFQTSKVLRFLGFGAADAQAGAIRVRGEGVLEDTYLLILEIFVALFIAAVWFWRYDARKARAVVSNLRGSRVAHYFLLASLGMALYLSDARVTDLFIFVKVLGVLCGLFFAFQFAVVVNDISDVACDKLTNAGRPLVTGSLDAGEYMKVAGAYLVFAGLFSYMVSDHSLMIVGLLVALSVLYSVPPLRLKRLYPFSCALIGAESMLAFLLGQLSLDPQGGLDFAYAPLWFLVFFIFFLASNVKDLKDVAGDRAAGDLTLPVMFGEAKARKVIAYFIFLSYLAVPVFLARVPRFRFSVPVIIFSLVFATANLLYVQKPRAKERAVFFMYFVYAFLLVLFLR